MLKSLLISIILLLSLVCKSTPLYDGQPTLTQGMKSPTIQFDYSNYYFNFTTMASINISIYGNVTYSSYISKEVYLQIDNMQEYNFPIGINPTTMNFTQPGKQSFNVFCEVPYSENETSFRIYASVEVSYNGIIVGHTYTSVASTGIYLYNQNDGRNATNQLTNSTSNKHTLRENSLNFFTIAICVILLTVVLLLLKYFRMKMPKNHQR